MGPYRTSPDLCPPSRASSAGADSPTILLLLPPFWPPLIPPMGIATLKARLNAEGYPYVSTIDLNCVEALHKHQKRYFDTLSRWIPKHKLGVVGKIGHEVLENHLLAWVNSDGHPAVVSKAMGEIIDRFFYMPVDPQLVRSLNETVSRFFIDLRNCVLQLLDSIKPDVLGLSVPGLGTLAGAQVALALFKARRPDGLAALGGSIFLMGIADSPDFETFLDHTSLADYIIVGDGIDELLAVLRGDRTLDRVLFARPPGAKPGSASRTGGLDYDDFDLSRYPYIGTEQTTSCPFSCGFCNLPRFHGPYKKRPAELMAQELMALYERHQHQLIYMADSLLNPVISDLTDELRRLPLPLYIDGFLRVQDRLCDYDTALSLRRGGLYRARMGVESGSQRVLDLMDKRITVKQAAGTVRALAAAGIKTTVYLVAGYPGETEADFQETIDWIDELQNDIWQVDCRPFTYWYSGQCEDKAWASLRRPLYSPDTARLLLIQSWTLDCDPSREEAFSRMNRLVRFCESCGIADPHDMRTIHSADERWRRLHANAVPPLLEFQQHRTIYECRRAEPLLSIQSALDHSDAFSF